jgi:pseudouridine kinase
VDIKAKTLGAHVPATSNPGTVSITAGGVARNIAHNLGMLGADVSLLSVLGNDTNGEMLLAHTASAHVNTAKIIRVNEPTGTYVATLNERGELITAVSDMRLLQNITNTIINRNKDEIEAARFIIADCNLTEESLNQLALLASHKLLIEPVSVSKSKKLLSLLQNHRIYLATPNLDQIESLTGTRNIAEAAAKLHALGLQNIAIHAGEQGAYVSDGKNITHIPAQAKSISDVTGAGDAATAGLIQGLIQNLALEKAAVIGQEMAARVIASNKSTLD